MRPHHLRRSELLTATAYVRNPLRRAARRAELRRALDHGQFVAHYQPIRHLSTGHVVAVEALARWDRNDTLQLPAEFIDDIEAFGLHHELGGRMLMGAMRDLEHLKRDGLVEADARVHVNVSARQLDGLGRLDDVERCAAALGVPTTSLTIELTETSAAANPAVVHAMLAECRARGVNVAIDDVGSGYASLTLLHSLPFDHLKIDKRYVHGVAQNEAGAAIVAGLVAIARARGVPITAEGVETAADERVLVELGVDHVQGFRYDTPRSLGDLRQRLAVEQRHDRPLRPSATPPSLSLPVDRAEAILHRATEQLHAFADALERLLPAVREARQLAATLTDHVDRIQPEHAELAADQALGFDRLDAARRRVLRAVHDDWDVVESWRAD